LEATVVSYCAKGKLFDSKQRQSQQGNGQNMKRLIITVCCLGSLAATNVGWASLTQLSINSSYSVGNQTVRQGNVNHSTTATAFVATRTSGAPLPTGHPDPFLTFCLSIDGSLSSPSGWQSAGFSDPLATDGLRKTDSLYRAANLYSHFGAGVLSLGLTTYAGKVEGAALQLAIWEVLYEDASFEYDVTTSQSSDSGFRVTSGIAGVNTRANEMLTGQWSAINKNIETTFWNADGGNQDLIGPMTPVPEPATILAGALLLLPFGASTLRVLRRNRTA
jgi:hypothetical protein